MQNLELDQIPAAAARKDGLAKSSLEYLVGGITLLVAGGVVKSNPSILHDIDPVADQVRAYAAMGLGVVACTKAFVQMFKQFPIDYQIYKVAVSQVRSQMEELRAQSPGTSL